MPILPSEPSVFPEDLFECNALDESGDRHWYVLHTRPQQEKSLARDLRTSRVPFYLPLVSRKHRYRGRPITSFVPLFQGYVFLLADPDERLIALQTRRVAQQLPVSDAGQMWSDLERTQRLIDSGAPITQEDRLGPGSPVVIRSGPFVGLEGTVHRCSSGHRFVVYVNFIQQGASVLIDDYDLAPLN